MKILVIIPAYNEQDNILNTIDDINRQCPEMDYVVINDCSTDDTERILRENDKNYLSLSCNLGIGGGVQTGYRYASEKGYDIAIQFDGDGQHEARFLRDLVAPIEAGEADIAIGSRFIRREGFQSTGLRRAGIGFLSGLIKLLCGIHIQDVTSGMRAVNRRFIEQYAASPTPRTTPSPRPSSPRRCARRGSWRCPWRCASARAARAPSTPCVRSTTWSRSPSP